MVHVLSDILNFLNFICELEITIRPNCLLNMDLYKDGPTTNSFLIQSAWFIDQCHLEFKFKEIY